ncbi:MAG: hypothetical protein WCG83_03600 [Candidatus Peregrinibacteria bacterium]
MSERQGDTGALDFCAFVEVTAGNLEIAHNVLNDLDDQMHLAGDLRFPWDGDDERRERIADAIARGLALLDQQDLRSDVRGSLLSHATASALNVFIWNVASLFNHPKIGAGLPFLRVICQHLSQLLNDSVIHEGHPDSAIQTFRRLILEQLQAQRKMRAETRQIEGR